MAKAALHAKASIPGIRRWPTPRSKDWTLQFLIQASRDENIVAVVVVGSAVRPAVRSVDLDLIVICRAPSDLRVEPPLEVDLRAYRADQVEEGVARGNDMLGWAIKFGRGPFQRSGYWDALLGSWSNRLPLPSRTVALQRAGEAFERMTKVLDLGDLDAAEEQAVSYATHLARAELLARNVYPASRPELPLQLRAIGSDEAADCLSCLIDPTVDHSAQIRALVDARRSRDPVAHRPTSKRPS